MSGLIAFNFLIIDERKGRLAAKRQRVIVTGSRAIMVQLKNKGVISQVAPFLNAFKKSGYALSEGLVAKILELAGE